MKKLFILATLLLFSVVSFSQNDKICLKSIENKIQIGQMMGNRNLTFGFKNILLEYLQEKDLQLVDSCNLSDFQLQIELIYFDVLKTNSGFSVIHKENDETVLRVKGKLINSNGKKIKETLVTEKSSEISMSTLIIAEGGKINQQSVSNVIKKCCETLIKNLFG
jgi:hypothetical protein